MCGSAPAALVGCTGTALGLGAAALTVWDVAVDVAFEGFEAPLAFSLQTADGERHYVARLEPERDDAGRVVSVLAIMQDMTEQRQSEQQRTQLLAVAERARAEAEASNRAKDQFLAVLSHELRTPLHAIVGWVRLLREGVLSPEKREHAIETIERNAMAQTRIIEDLLDVSRMVSGKLRLSVRDVALAPPLRAAVEAVRPMADARGVVVDTVLDEDLLRARVDPDRIQQIVWNLVTNAVKFTGRGGRVAVALARHGDAAVLRVVDTGRGIRADFLPHIFERFRQADASTTREHGGLGLGLAITRQLVELHGGTIRAESPGEGGGAAFVVELPLAVGREDTADEVRAGATEGVDARAGAAPTLAGLRVLLIEDDDGTRDAIRWTLERAGAEVTALKSPVRALETFRERLGGQRFDVLVSDIGMPELDGYALLREVRDIERERDLVATTPALAVTAYARPEDRERALAAGFDEHVSKPVEPQRLVNLVAALAGRDEAPRG
jgi:signal transduction histidine kinase/ActR/RegA family two-component response regulator